MTSILNRLETLDLDFTDTQLIGSAGLTFLASTVRHFGFLRDVNGFEPCKVRDRGASDHANVWSLITRLASGRGTLRDLDDLRLDRATRQALGLAAVSGSRGMGEKVAVRRNRRRMTPAHVGLLRLMATASARRLTPTLIAYERQPCGFVPLFLDGTAIEVTGERSIRG